MLLARDLNALFTGMPDDMPGRFTHLVGNYNLVAEYLHNKQFSGLTKFAWFHSPRGWTMYDSLAAWAMKVRSPDRYYGMLVELGFAEAATTANGHLEANGFGYLFGERIIDQLMLLKSNLDPMSAFRTAEAYLYWLPAEQRSSLERCAFEVACGLDNHPLVSHLR
ncbi:hypothetical protein C8J35_1064 [Rhizobium sp. PP-F2F-G38]|nr:hypothetical protein C8J35_1064 [Rhizobium sp. PP-F2F-G38]